MPRLARLDAPEVVHHVIIRGIERRNIFRDNNDRNDMIDCLANLLPATKERVAEIMGITPEEVPACNKAPQTVRARSLLCFWAHRKLGMRTTEIAGILNMSQPAISRSSRKGEKIAGKNRFDLINE